MVLSIDKWVWLCIFAGMSKAFLLLGSNRGDRAATFKAAEVVMENAGIQIAQRSSLYETAPWGFEDDTPFLNQVLAVQTTLQPQELLTLLLAIEKDLGRTRSGQAGYSSRTIDLDILFFNDEVIATETLKVPHPRLHQRQFTLTPLAEIAPDLVHPVSQKSIKVLQVACTDQLPVKKLAHAL